VSSALLRSAAPGLRLPPACPPDQEYRKPAPSFVDACRAFNRCWAHVRTLPHRLCSSRSGTRDIFLAGFPVWISVLKERASILAGRRRRRVPCGTVQEAREISVALTSGTLPEPGAVPVTPSGQRCGSDGSRARRAVTDASNERTWSCLSSPSSRGSRRWAALNQTASVSRLTQGSRAPKGPSAGRSFMGDRHGEASKSRRDEEPGDSYLSATGPMSRRGAMPNDA